MDTNENSTSLLILRVKQDRPCRNALNFFRLLALLLTSLTGGPTERVDPAGGCRISVPLTVVKFRLIFHISVILHGLMGGARPVFPVVAGPCCGLFLGPGVRRLRGLPRLLCSATSAKPLFKCVYGLPGHGDPHRTALQGPPN